ncbi:MAG: beta-propeller domain-containing protein [Oscillospiraceae bacterium]|nr:beta-propeller domain-containing protein [Oscillospiraceae bacterium]
MRYEEYNTDEKLDAVLKEELSRQPVPSQLLPDAMTEQLHAQKRSGIVHSKKGNRRILAGMCAGLLIVTCLAGVWNHTKEPPLSADQCYMEHAGSYHKLYRQVQYLASLRTPNKKPSIFNWNTKKDTMAAPGATNDVLFDSAEQESVTDRTENIGNQTNPQHSETITQTEGIDEADCIKTDGKAIYYLQQKALWYVPVSRGDIGEPISIVPEIENTKHFNAMELYLHDDYVAVIYHITKNDDSTFVAAVTFRSGEDGTLQQIGAYLQEGVMPVTRMIDGTLYLVSKKSMPIHNNLSEKNLSGYVPRCGSETPDYLPADDILIPDQWSTYSTSLSYTLLSIVDAKTASALDHKAFAGCGNDIYMSHNGLYLNVFSEGKTRITRVSVENDLITPVGVAAIKGSVLNQYSMSEHEGVFRVAAHSDTNTLYTFDLEMRPLDEISFAPGETIKAVNFVGTRGYVVTFLQTDPLFSIDCSDPEHLVMNDAYKVSGYSTFLYPWEDLLFSFGVEQTDAVQGLKLMMYETAPDGTLIMQDDYVFGDLTGMLCFSSPAVSDFHALYLNVTEQLIGIPVAIDRYGYYSDAWTWEDQYSSSFNGYPIGFNGYYFFRYENGAFVEAGFLPLENMTDINVRCVSIEDYVYCVSVGQLISADMQTFTQCDRITLPYPN